MIDEMDPVAVRNDQLELLQSCFTQEGHAEFVDDNNSTFFGDDPLSDGGARGIDTNGEWIEWEFENEYLIEENDVGVHVRDAGWDGGVGGSNEIVGIEWTLDGVTLVDPNAGVSITHSWTDIGGDDYGSDPWDRGDLEPGTHTLRVEVTDDSSGGPYLTDVVAPLDERFTYDFDNDVHEPQGYLDGPELFPDQHVQEFAEASTRRDVTAAGVTQSWNDTSAGQFIQASNDGGATWLPDDGTEDNTESISVTFASPETGVQTRVGMNRYGGPRDATPRFGFEGQAIDSHELFADVDAITPDGRGQADARAIVAPGTIAGETLREAGQLTASDDLLTRSIFADIIVGNDERIISSEAVSWDNP